jgi:DNA-binding GntR family transcriptional regulator
MSQLSLSSQVAAQILELVEQDGLAEGERLPERALAERLRVSRSPVREALKLLAERGAVTPLERGGFAVGAGDSGAVEQPAEDDAVYFAIADDRLSGKLPDRVSENELMRRYGLSRGHLAKLLRRISSEGWLERLPGHGWAFMPTLTSGEALTQSYMFRMEIEPAALLQPTFVLDRPGLERSRAQQQAMLERGLAGASPVQHYEVNASFHETLIACSRNPFFVDSLKRIIRLRRLVAYRRIVGRPAGETQFGDHIRIIDRVLEGDRKGAAAMLRVHLEESMRRPIPHE